MSLSFRTWAVAVVGASSTYAAAARADITQVPPDGTIIPHISSTTGACTSGLNVQACLDDSEQMLGPGGLETLTARSSLAAAHFAAGRPAEAIPLLQRTLADSERYLGPGHPLTAAVRDNLEAASRK